MSKKSKKAAVLDSDPIYGVGGYADSKARMKYQDLMRDYHQLQKEADAARSKLEAGKQRKMVLAAEVRFLRRRYEYFAKANFVSSVQKEKPPNLSTHTSHTMGLGRKEAGHHKLPPILESKPKKKRGKECDIYSKLLQGEKEDAQQSSTPFPNFDHKGRAYPPKKKAKTGNITTAFDLNLSQDVKEVSFPSRAPTFDLNEISTGDEDFQSNFEPMKFEGVKKSLTRGPNDEMQNDLMLSMCRGATGEDPSRVGKRKISWQDPFPLRV